MTCSSLFETVVLPSTERLNGTTVIAPGTKDQKVKTGLLGKLCLGNRSVSVKPSKYLVRIKEKDIPLSIPVQL